MDYIDNRLESIESETDENKASAAIVYDNNCKSVNRNINRNDNNNSKSVSNEKNMIKRCNDDDDVVDSCGVSVNKCVHVKIENQTGKSNDNRNIGMKSDDNQCINNRTMNKIDDEKIRKNNANTVNVNQQLAKNACEIHNDNLTNVSFTTQQICDNNLNTNNNNNNNNKHDDAVASIRSDKQHADVVIYNDNVNGDNDDDEDDDPYAELEFYLEKVKVSAILNESFQPTFFFTFRLYVKNSAIKMGCL